MGLFDRMIGAGKSANESDAGVKPGRNEPCWCGSGKKYKKCHLSEDDNKASAKACSLNCGPT
jgi:hypothetical protein